MLWTFLNLVNENAKTFHWKNQRKEFSQLEKFWKISSSKYEFFYFDLYWFSFLFLFAMRKWSFNSICCTKNLQKTTWINDKASKQFFCNFSLFYVYCNFYEMSKCLIKEIFRSFRFNGSSCFLAKNESWRLESVNSKNVSFRASLKTTAIFQDETNSKKWGWFLRPYSFLHFHHLHLPTQHSWPDKKYLFYRHCRTSLKMLCLNSKFLKLDHVDIFIFFPYFDCHAHNFRLQSPLS